MDNIDKNIKFIEVTLFESFSINDLETYLFKKGWSLSKQTKSSFIYFHKKTKKQIKISLDKNENNSKCEILKSILKKMLFKKNSECRFLKAKRFFDYLLWILLFNGSLLYLLFSTDYLQAIKGMFFSVVCYYLLNPTKNNN